MNWLDPGWSSRPRDRGSLSPGRGHLDSTWGGVRRVLVSFDSLGNLRHVLLLYFYRNSADTAFSVSMEGLPTASDGTGAPPAPGSMSSQAAAMCSK